MTPIGASEGSVLVDFLKEVVIICGDGKEAFRPAIPVARTAKELYAAAKELEEKRRRERGERDIDYVF